ncbi:uncharacterized protein LOC130855211 [Hippopotamus amphibius kiboko]|uniref:uncharacterized protein LOC130855211 n=1 Tax=Hippopotamus amphibius kiboko TaxID=575201 RepID=UPI00259589D0|nr:uncharacterized protein LOC130855211 [Hippopotamus amphibius kiboko]
MCAFLGQAPQSPPSSAPSSRRRGPGARRRRDVARVLQNVNSPGEERRPQPGPRRPPGPLHFYRRRQRVRPGRRVPASRARAPGPLPAAALLRLQRRSAPRLPAVSIPGKGTTRSLLTAPTTTTVKNSETALPLGCRVLARVSRGGVEDPLPGEREGPLPSDSTDPVSPGSLARNPCFILHPSQGCTLGPAGFVAGEKFSFCREVPGLCSEAARDVLVGLEESCGVCTIGSKQAAPWWLTVGGKLATDGKACPNRPRQLTARLRRFAGAIEPLKQLC